MTDVTAESVSQMTEKTKNVKELIKALHGEKGREELSYFYSSVNAQLMKI